jgi:hypothetical protein
VERRDGGLLEILYGYSLGGTEEDLEKHYYL